MRKRNFHLSDILTITTGKLVSSRHMDGVYDILNFMTGESLFTHQLSRAMDACKLALLRQHPRLAEIDPSTLVVTDGGNAQEQCNAWVNALIPKYGKTLPVAPLNKGEYKTMSPIDEARKVFGKDKVIVVQPPEGE